MTVSTPRNQSFDWGKRTYLMGVLNVTPDSFSDGGQFTSVSAALAQAEKLIIAGADILDIGGQSTRPGATVITPEEELNRTIPVIAAIRDRFPTTISIDTTRSKVAKAAVEAGADWVNDISGGTFDQQMFTRVAQLAVPLVLMHIRGNPQTMQKLTNYQDLIADVSQFLTQQVEQAIAAGVKRSRLIIDPGIGFAKTYEQNLILLRQLSEFRSLDLPILVGPSRKSFIGYILQQDDPKKRVWGTAAACCAAIAGGADILRVHDVEQMRDACLVADAIWRSSMPNSNLTRQLS